LDLTAPEAEAYAAASTDLSMNNENGVTFALWINCQFDKSEA